jgi:hypothetical protein
MVPTLLCVIQTIFQRNCFKLISLLLILLLFLPSSARTQAVDSDSFVPDRPGFATPPHILTQKAFELDNGFQYEKYSMGNINTENILFSSLLLRYGLLENAELRVQSDYAYSMEKSSSTISRIEGMNPITIGTKIKLFEQQNIVPNVGVLINVTLPFIGKAEFRPENTAPSCYLLISNDVSEKLNLCTNYGLSWDGSSSSPTHFYAFCFGINLDNGLSTFIEGYGYINSQSVSKHYVDAGLAYLITHNLQVDLSAAGSLNSFSGYLLLNMGIAWKI